MLDVPVLDAEEVPTLVVDEVPDDDVELVAADAEDVEDVTVSVTGWLTPSTVGALELSTTAT